MDEGLDTGPIIKCGLVQLYYPRSATFNYVHQRLEAEMVAGLYGSWDKITDRTYNPTFNNPDRGNYYSVKQFKELEWLLDKEFYWHTLIQKAKDRYEDSRRRK